MNECFSIPTGDTENFKHALNQIDWCDHFTNRDATKNCKVFMDSCDCYLGNYASVYEKS